MPRILALVLALIVAGVAFVLDHRMELYAVAAVLALIAFVLFVNHARVQSRSRKQPYSTPRSKRPAAPSIAPKEGAFDSLGVGQVRPRVPATRSTAPPTDAAPELSATVTPETPSVPSTDASPNPFAPPSAASSPPAPDALVPSTFSASTQAADDRPIPELVADPLVQAALAALGTHTVALLRRIGSDQYAVDAIHSLSGAARGRGCTFAPGVALARRDDTPLGVQVRSVGDRDFPRAALGYYRSVPAVRQLAYIPVEADGTRYILLADSLATDAFDGPSTRVLLTHFATVLNALAPQDLGADTEREPDARRVDRPAATPPEPRSRREIIAEEMAAANTARTPLALVMMGLRASDAVAASGPATARDALDRLTQRILHLSPEVRIEPFGDLLLGAFVRRDADGVAEWAERLQEDVSRQVGPLREGVSIGAALMQSGQTDPQTLRDDATEALMEAHAEGEAVIFE